MAARAGLAIRTRLAAIFILSRSAGIFPGGALSPAVQVSFLLRSGKLFASLGQVDGTNKKEKKEDTLTPNLLTSVRLR